MSASDRALSRARPLALLALVSLLTTGCVATAAGGGAATGDAGVVASPSPVPIPDGVVATGTMMLADGTDAGPVTVTKSGSTYDFDYPRDWLPDDPGNSLTEAVSDSPFTIDECGSDNIWQLGAQIGQIGSFLDEAYPDPTFFTALLVVQPGTAVAGTTCQQPILAKADLTWTTPVTRPWVDPVDGGARNGAQGGVEIVDGRMLYTTASGDVWSEIARRFGIDRADLAWLNPIRHPDEVDMAYVGQVLNLDPQNRGDSEARRPQ